MKYVLYQLSRGKIEKCPYAFRGWDKAKDRIALRDYCEEYAGELSGTSVDIVLEQLFDKFNLSIPVDFYGRSMAVSDLVEINGQYYYCDNVGWVNATEALKASKEGES